jgi:hypothetical protein
MEALYELCTTGGLVGIFVWSDLTIALSYYSIPISMLLVLRNRKEDLPFPAVWILFVTFIAACGTTHLIHVFSQLQPGETWLEGGVRMFTATVSAVTAAAMAFLMPKIKNLPSPKQVELMLTRERDRCAVERDHALAARDHAIKDMYHRVGNIAAITSAALRLEQKPGADPLEIKEQALEAIRALALQHQEIAHDVVLRAETTLDLARVNEEMAHMVLESVQSGLTEPAPGR